MSTRPEESAKSVARSLLEAEVGTITDALDKREVPLRVLGSLGVSLHCPSSTTLLHAFKRTYADIDFAGYQRDASVVSSYLASVGYLEDREVAMTSEGRRGLFDHPGSGIHIDVFYDRLEFCHVIPLEMRLEGDRPTIPLAELLLSKLQIVNINEKDIVDIVLLLLDHDLGEPADDVIDIGRVARLCAGDWGLWRTTTLNLEKVATLAAAYPQLDAARRERVSGQVATLRVRVDAAPKSFGWRARSRVGERVKWWTDVDEVL